MARKGTKQKVDLAALEEQYQSIVGALTKFSLEIGKQIEKLVDDTGVTLGFPLTNRIKKWSSIVDKLERVDLSISKLTEMQDLVGYRIVLLYRRDLEVVCSALRKHFVVTGEYDTQERLKEDQFGYSSRHLILRLPEIWMSVPTMTGLGEFLAEIQVRTLPQHIWAAASHDLQYKQEAGVPTTLRRALYRVSALLETVDIEFERLLVDREIYRASLSTALELTDSKLNVDSLENLLDELLPAENKREPEAYSDLLTELERFEMATPGAVRTLAEIWLATALQVENERLEVARKDLDTLMRLNPTRAGRIARGVYFTHVGLMRAMLAHALGAHYENYFVAQRSGIGK